MHPGPYSAFLSECANFNYSAWGGLKGYEKPAALEVLFYRFSWMKRGLR
jgi:hypothetical protein